MVAIIALLSTMIIVSLDASKEKARIAAVKATASQLLHTIEICAQEPNAGITAPEDDFIGGGLICTAGTGDAKWPSLGRSGYQYAASDKTDITNGIYTFNLIDTSGKNPAIFCRLATNQCN